MYLQSDSGLARITLNASSLTDLAINAGIFMGCNLGCQLEYPIHGLGMWLGLSHNKWPSFKNKWPKTTKYVQGFFFFLSTQHFYDPVLDVSQYHFCCTQLVKAVTKVHPISRKRYINLITQWEEHNTTFQEPHVGWKILGSYLWKMQYAIPT